MAVHMYYHMGWEGLLWGGWALGERGNISFRGGSVIHAMLHSFIHPFIHTFIHSFIHSFIYSFIHTFIHSSIHLLSFIHTFMCSCISFIHWSGHIHRSECGLKTRRWGGRGEIGRITDLSPSLPDHCSYS